VGIEPGDCSGTKREWERKRQGEFTVGLAKTYVMAIQRTKLSYLGFFF
jgi:hypothetical protein